MRIAPAIILSSGQRAILEQWARSRSLPARVVERARIVLLAAGGRQDKRIAAAMKITPKKVSRWRSRLLTLGLAGLQHDASRPGRSPKLTASFVRRVVNLTTRQTPPNATHWSTRSMAAAVGISEASVRRIWRSHGLKPHRMESFKISNDPQFVEKLEDIVGLYLNPPEHALVLCVDEKSQIQALDRTQPGLPLKRGRSQTLTHDYKRNGTATLFAALNAANGEVYGFCQERHRHQEWLKFLRLLDQTMPPTLDLHLISDNYATHKHPKVQRWLARHPRLRMHFTPTSASWLNMVERFFRDLTQNRLRRGVFRDLRVRLNPNQTGPIILADFEGGPMAETRKLIDCRRFPADKPCSIVISGTEDDVLDLAIIHATTRHGHADTPELRDELRSMLQDESSATSEAT